MSTFKVLAIGDSNTNGAYTGIAWSVWATRLRDALAAALPGDTVTLTNNAVGATCSGSLETNYATWVGDESPSLVVIVYGTNDAYYDNSANSAPNGDYPHGDGKDHSASAFQTRMTTIVNNALALTDASGRRTRVILCSPPPAAVQADAMTSWRDATRLSQITTAAAAVAAATGCTYVDLWTSMQVPASWKADYILDGVHMTSAGQQAIADALLTPALTALGVAAGYGNTVSTGYDDGAVTVYEPPTASIAVDPASPAWNQIDTQIVVRVTADAPSTVPVTFTSPDGSLVWFRGTDADLFEVSLDGTTWKPLLDVPAGETDGFLRVTPAAPGTALTAEVGISA